MHDELNGNLLVWLRLAISVDNLADFTELCKDSDDKTSPVVTKDELIAMQSSSIVCAPQTNVSYPFNHPVQLSI